MFTPRHKRNKGFAKKMFEFVESYEKFLNEKLEFFEWDALPTERGNWGDLDRKPIEKLADWYVKMGGKEKDAKDQKDPNSYKQMKFVYQEKKLPTHLAQRVEV